MKTRNYNNGFTLIEIVIIIAISVIIISIVISSFYTILRTQALDRDYISVASLIDQAKSASINSKDASSYGVYFSSSTAVLFKGQNYIASSTTNQPYSLNSRVNISAINLVGSSTNQIVFDRLTGYANASGTVAFSFKNQATSTKLIRIYKTGLIEYR